MKIGMIIAMLGSLGLVVALTVAMPNISRPTVPLGVSVPSNRVHDPVVSTAIRRFRWCSLIGGLVAAVAPVVRLTPSGSHGAPGSGWAQRCCPSCG